MREEREDDKAALVALYLQSRYDKEARGKSATSVTAGLWYSFITALLPCQSLDSPIIVAARTACRLSTTELREKWNEGASTSVKLPLCKSILIRMRHRFWVSCGWDRGGIDQKIIYLAAMWAYNMDARVREYTAPEREGKDHCVRVGDLDFEMASGEGKKGAQMLPGSESAASQKTGSFMKMKLIGRRTPEEGQFLDDLISWVTHSGVTEADRLFSRYTELKCGRKSKKELTARIIRGQIKETYALENLPAEHFSSHSLCEAATTHMRALGASEEDTKDRGGYASGSRVMAYTYDYSSAGHGPLSSNALNGGARPDVQDILRFIPQAWREGSPWTVG